VGNTELSAFDFQECRNLLENLREYFVQRGIFVSQSSRVVSSDTKTAVTGDADVAELQLTQFAVSEDIASLAFYLNINNINDVESYISRFVGDLEKLHGEIAAYAEQNGELNETERRKISLINTNVSKTKGVLGSRGRKLLADCREKNSVEEQRSETAKMFGKIIQEKLLTGAMDPIYEDRRLEYGFVLRKLNEFLARWGIMTLSLQVGSEMDYEMPCEVLPGSEEGAEGEHGTIRKIHRLPYVWREDRSDLLPVWNGQVSLWR